MRVKAIDLQTSSRGEMIRAAVDSLIDQHRAVDEALILERRLVSRVEIDHCSTGPVALGAVGVQVGTRRSSRLRVTSLARCETREAGYLRRP